MNTYAYVDSNPVSLIDPLGLHGETAEGGVSCPSCHDPISSLRDWLKPLLNENANEDNSTTEENAGSCPVDKNKEPNHPDFKPHKKKSGSQKIPWNKDKKGFPDKSGNYWEPVPDGHKGTHDPHWDVQHPDKSHTAVYPIK